MPLDLTLADKLYLRELIRQYDDGLKNVERDEMLPNFGITRAEAERLLEED